MINRVFGEGSGSTGQVEQAQENARKLAEAAGQQLKRAGSTARHYIMEQPARALGFALGIGVFLGWLIKRR